MTATRDDETTEIQWWTVVGVTEARRQCRVEHVATSGAADADCVAAKACERFPADNPLLVVAVFRGRVRDELASETAERWPLAELPEETEGPCSS